jgi:hypothetical protein
LTITGVIGAIVIFLGIIGGCGFLPAFFTKIDLRPEFYSFLNKLISLNAYTINII